MTLLEELTNDIGTPGSRLSDILRKAKILAARLGNADLSQWIDNELYSYRVMADVPEYRRVTTILLGDFAEPFGGQTLNLPLDTSKYPDDARQFFEWHVFSDSVRQLESLIEGGEQRLDGILPTKFNRMFSNQEQGVVCIKLHQTLTKGQIEQVLDSVRTRLLDFDLELEKVAPEAGEKASRIAVPEERVSQIFNTTIIGSHNVMASGHTVSQVVQQSVTTGDMASLDAALREIGIATDEVQSLHDAIAADGPRTATVGLGQQVQTWIGRFSTSIASGAVKVTTELAPVIVARLVAKYYGWG